jgi:tripartite-type tricarboxylate transporter receptor subunit TctC
LPPLPDVPTFAEAGLPGYGLTSVNGIIAPAKTPRHAIDRIAKEMAAILASADMLDFLSRQGAEAFVSTPSETDALIRSEMNRYGKIIKQAGIKFQP